MSTLTSSPLLATRSFGTRHQFTVSATVTILSPLPGINRTGTFRLKTELLDDQSQPVTLYAGGTAAYSDSFTTTVGFAPNPPSVTETLSAAIRPGAAVDLGAGRVYTVRFTVQRLGSLVWLDSAGLESSDAFTIVHFRDATQNGERWVRAYPTAGTTWSRQYRIRSINNLKSFRATLPVFIARYHPSGSTATISFRLTAELKDFLGNVIPLEGGRHQYLLACKRLFDE